MSDPQLNQEDQRKATAIANILHAWKMFKAEEPVIDPGTTINDVLRDHLIITQAPQTMRMETVQLFDFLHEVATELERMNENPDKTDQKQIRIQQNRSFISDF